jgi:tetratricopeptide (TPR) repeat protein
MKIARIVFLTFLIINLVAALSAQPVEQSFARLFSYDPHPSTALFTDKAPYNGQLADIEIKFSETWQQKNDMAVISQMAFTVTARKDGQVIGQVQTPNFSITPMLNKDAVLARTTLGNLNFQATMDSLTKSNAGVTNITIVFSLGYNAQELSSAKDTLANQATAASMNMCRRLAKTADSLPDKNKKTKISLYKKALLATPEPGSSPAADSFRKTIEQKIIALGGEVIQEQPEPKVAPVKYEPAYPTKPKPDKPASHIAPSAKKLYNEARTLLAQGKGPEGREALRQALSITPDYYDALVLLGDNAFGNRKFSRAKEAFSSALEQNDKDPDTILKYFKACYYMGEGSDAINYLVGIKNRYPSDNRIKLTVSEAYFQLGDLPNARQLCEEVLNGDPGSYQAKDLLQRIDRLMK